MASTNVAPEASSRGGVGKWIESRAAHLDADPALRGADARQMVGELIRRFVHAFPRHRQQRRHVGVHRRELGVAHLQHRLAISRKDEAVIPVGQRRLESGQVADVREAVDEQHVHFGAVHRGARGRDPRVVLGLGKRPFRRNFDLLESRSSIPRPSGPAPNHRAAIPPSPIRRCDDRVRRCGRHSAHARRPAARRRARFRTSAARPRTPCRESCRQGD